MTHYDDETLGAYVDGELARDTAMALEVDLKNDLNLHSRVAHLRAINASLREWSASLIPPRETMRPTGVTGRQEPLSNYSKRVPMARGPQPVFTVGGIANAKGPDAWHPAPRSGPVGWCVEDGLLRHLDAKLTSSPRCEAYFVTWPRISPPGLAAVWMLT